MKFIGAWLNPAYFLACSMKHFQLNQEKYLLLYSKLKWLGKFLVQRNSIVYYSQFEIMH